MHNNVENIPSMQKFGIKSIFVSLIIHFLIFRYRITHFSERSHVTIDICPMVAIVTMILKKIFVLIILFIISRKTIYELIWNKSPNSLKLLNENSTHKLQ